MAAGALSASLAAEGQWHVRVDAAVAHVDAVLLALCATASAQSPPLDVAPQLTVAMASGAIARAASSRPAQGMSGHMQQQSGGQDEGSRAASNRARIGTQNLGPHNSGVQRLGSGVQRVWSGVQRAESGLQRRGSGHAGGGWADADDGSAAGLLVAIELQVRLSNLSLVSVSRFLIVPCTLIT